VDMYRAYLMRDRVGEEYDGQVSGVTSFGLFVQVDEPFIEGLLRADALGEERFEYDAEGLRLYGRRSGRGFGLGDSVRVRVENVSVARRRIDFALVAAAPHVRSPERERHRKGKGGRERRRGRKRR